MMIKRWILVLSVLLGLGACGGVAPPKAPVTLNHELDSLMVLAAYPNSETLTVLATMQEFMGSHREWAGYEYFGRLTQEQPSRAVFFSSLQGAMAARVANDVPLLRRVAWVETAIAQLDAGAKADPLLGRFGRGLVYAELPDRFGKTQQAVDDLEACLARRDELPIAMDRGIYSGLATAYERLGNVARAKEMREHAALVPGDPAILGNVSVDATDGYRFSEKRLVKEADGVYVAEGYDFANLAFIVTPKLVVAIDAGTTPRNAADAVRALREVTKAPIKYVVLTHGHWDHVGGLSALREPGTVVIAQAGFPVELARSRAYPPPFRSFFGSDAIPLDAKPDRLVAARETLIDEGIDIDLIPVRGGETDDALFIHDKKHDILFVGDAFMPYLGSPFVAEGSADGYLEAANEVLRAKPRRLVHGHPPLTAFFTIEAMPGLEKALRALDEHTVNAARNARPLADVLHDEYLPDSLRTSPKAVMPYLIARDTFVQRRYRSDAGYWSANGDGMDVLTRAELASALDLLGGESDEPFGRAVDELLRRGDAPLALRIAELGLEQHPKSAPLEERRARALKELRERYAPINPFRFIVYSDLAGRGVAPVKR